MAKKAKKSTVAIIVAGAISLGVIGAAVGVMGYGTDGFEDWSFPNFVSKTEEVIPTETVNGDNIEIIAGESNGISLMSAKIAPEDYEYYGISPRVTVAQILTASFTPETTTNKAVTWTVSGGNGKVSVQASSSNQLEANVMVTGSFTTKATVTCTSVADPTVKATTNVEYLKTIRTDDYLGGGDNTSLKDTFDIPCLYFGDGTLAPVTAYGNVDVRMNSALYNHLRGKGYNVDEVMRMVSKDPEPGQPTINILYSPTDSETTFEECFMSNLTADEKLGVYSAICVYYGDQTDMSAFSFEISNVTVEYSNGIVREYSGIVQTQPFTISGFADLEVMPNDIQLSPSGSLIFGG